MRTAALRVFFAAAALAAASQARAQFVQLTRCQAAMPCAIPFGIRYKPDPLLAAAWGNMPHTVISMRADPARPFETPAIDLSKALDRQDWAREAARIFVLRNPPKPQTAPPGEAAAEPEKSPSPKS